MAPRTEQRDSAAGDSELDALNKIRLQQNWSYQGLSDDMARAGFPVPAKTLQNLIVYRPNKPYDRTLYQIRQYLEFARRDEAAVTNQSLARGQ